MNEIKFSGYLTFEDSRKLIKAIEDKKLFSTSGIATILLVAAITLIFIKISLGIIQTIFIISSMAFIFGGIIWSQYRSSQKANKKAYKAGCIQREGLLNKDMIKITTDKAFTEMQWDLFEKSLELEGIIAVVKGKEYLGFASYMFDSESDWIKAKEVIKGVL